MKPLEILEEFKSTELAPLPRKAMVEASAHSAEMVPLFIDLIERAVVGADKLSPGDADAILFAIFLLAEWNEKSAYRPIVKLLHLPSEQLDRITGDVLTESYWQIICSVWDGDSEPLRELVLDPEADEYARVAGIRSLIAISLRDEAAKKAVQSIIGEFHTAFAHDDDTAKEILWHHWATMAARIGTIDHMALARQTYPEKCPEGEFCDFSDIEQIFAYSCGSAPSPFWWDDEYPTIDSAIGEMETWYCFSDEFLKTEKRRHLEKNFFEGRNPYEHLSKVGRNDPCPCGSGKKFKKCCLH